MFTRFIFLPESAICDIGWSCENTIENTNEGSINLCLFSWKILTRRKSLLLDLHWLESKITCWACAEIVFTPLLHRSQGLLQGKPRVRWKQDCCENIPTHSSINVWVCICKQRIYFVFLQMNGWQSFFYIISKYKYLNPWSSVNFWDLFLPQLSLLPPPLLVLGAGRLVLRPENLGTRHAAVPRRLAPEMSMCWMKFFISF